MMAVADGTVQLKMSIETRADLARVSLLFSSSVRSFGFPSRTILIPMIALFLPTGNHDVGKNSNIDK